MFAVIYQGYIKSGRESEYREAWNSVARYFVEQRGAIGSCLHRTSDGLWLAYSRWPDKKTRDASWPGENAPSTELPLEIRKAVLIMYVLKNLWQVLKRLFKAMPSFVSIELDRAWL